MDNNVEIYIKKLIKLSSSMEEDGSYVIFNFNDEEHEEVSLLKENINHRNDDIIVDSSLENNRYKKIEIDPDAVKGWFRSFEEMYNFYFKKALKSELVASDKHFIIQNKNLDIDDDDIYNKFQTIQEWVDLFKNATKNVFIDTSGLILSFFMFEEVESEKKIKKHEVTLNSIEVKKRFLKIKSFPEQLKIKTSDIYSIEKLLITKNTLTSVVKSSNKTDDFLMKIFINPDLFIEKYTKSYDFYVNKHSIDKVVRDVESAKIDYFEKINNIISDNQAKVLSIPVVILGTSLVRAWNLMSLVLILTSMALSIFFVILNIKHKYNALDDCYKSASRVFHKIENNTISEDIKIDGKNIIINALTEIKTKKENAKNTINYILYGIFIAVSIWAIYLVLYFFDCK